jgi:hypothetical protein
LAFDARLTPDVAAFVDGLARSSVPSQSPNATPPSGRLPSPPLPAPPPGSSLLAALGALGGGGLILFALLAFGFLLAIPNAVRWLRPASALGLSPTYVALRDRPG